MSENSGIETPAAPEWLSKLENRREMLKRTKLGHEAGAGAPCTECGDKCPGLDLHFWRKVCRNCKCRKDQHMCTDDDLSAGWAQFEILGQIRSKPAFIKIKALASQPIQLEWVPPNVTPDVISDYMEKLGTQKIPVAGSEAALKRKQQLEFQVPPHDLDAALCDNLSETEANQLQLYVQRIRENCVGQGSVVRVGNHHMHAYVAQVIPSTAAAEAAETDAYVAAALDDPILCEIMSNENLQQALKCTTATHDENKLFIAFSTPICEKPSLETEKAVAHLSTPHKQRLLGLNKQALQSLVQHAAIYDKIFDTLQQKNLDVSRDSRLGPLADLRKEYLKNARLRQDIDEVLAATPSSSSTVGSPLRTPLKNNRLAEFVFNSPLPLKQVAPPMRTSAQMCQNTPMRKLRMGSNLGHILQVCGLPQQVEYERDPFFAELINSLPLKQALEGNQKTLALTTPLISPTENLDLSAPTKKLLHSMGVENGKALQSILLNQPFYDTLLDALGAKHIDYSQCNLLAPLQKLRLELKTNPMLNAELTDWLKKQKNNQSLTYDAPKTNLSNSNSSDSGFESKPTTPKSMMQDLLTATLGRFTSIPAIDDMSMYPTIEGHAGLTESLQQLHLTSSQSVKPLQPPIVTTAEFNCRDCGQPIVLGEVAVKAERAGRNIAWHPGCFKCYSCHELLADLVYFFHNGQVYCGRDLAIKLKIPRCKACDELIFTKEYTAAEGAEFHIKHFCCYHCDIPLAGQQYVPDEKTNMPLCLKCYEQYFAAACQCCQQSIGPADQGVALGEMHWHGSCFLCAGLNCGKSLIGGRFCVKQNLPFCSPICVRSIIK